jgi:hypothetical protein
MARQASSIGLRPTQAVTEDFGGIMERGLDRLARNKETARLEAERAEAKSAAFEEKFGIDESQFVLDDTEFRDVNDAATEAVSLYRDRMWEVKTQLKNDPNNDVLKKRLGKIGNSVKRLGAANNKIKELGDQFVTMLENDEISGVDEERIQNMLESVERGDIKIHMDENDDMSFLFYDEDKKLQNVSSFGDIMKESPTKRIDLDTDLEAFVGTIGRDKIDSVTGRFIKGSDVFGADQQRFTNDFIDSYLGVDAKSLKRNDALADLLNQATGGSSKKKTDFSEDERQFVKNWLNQQVKDRFDETISLKERPQPRAVSAAEAKKPRAVDINIAFQGSRPRRDSEGNFVFTIARPIAVDPTKSDRKIDTIKSDQQGNIIVEGEDRVKVKGVQDDSVESVAEREGVETSMIEELLTSDGSVQYYKRIPFSANSRDDSALINKVGNMFGVEDELGLRNILYQDMVEKFGQEVADRIIQEPTAQKQTQQKAPKEVKTQSGATYK